MGLRDVDDPSNAIAIRLHDDHYAELVIGVEDPQETAEETSPAMARG